LIVGVQNMYSSFEIIDANGADGQVTVRANLIYGEPKPWTFEVLNQDGTWQIDQITGPDVLHAPAPTAVTEPPSASGAIVYLDPDGVSIDRINADGSEQAQPYPNAAEALGQAIRSLGPTPGAQSGLGCAGHQYVT